MRDGVKNHQNSVDLSFVCEWPPWGKFLLFTSALEQIIILLHIFFIFVEKMRAFLYPVFARAGLKCLCRVVMTV